MTPFTLVVTKSVPFILLVMEKYAVLPSEMLNPAGSGGFT